MTTDFLHGVEVVTIDTGIRPIQTIRSSVIGLIGTAPDADESFPLDTPVLVQSRGDYAAVGATGSLKKALDGIFDQWGATVVVVRVDEGSDLGDIYTNIIGGEDAQTGALTGALAFRGAAATLGVSPMLLIAPEFTSDRPVGVSSVPVTAQGSGYTSAPTVAFTGGGSNANKVMPTAHAVLGTGATAGKVVSVVIDSPGMFLDSPPTVALSGGGGSGATLGTVVTAAQKNPAVAALQSLATQIRAHVIAAGPNTTDSDAIAYRNDFGDRRVFIVDPKVGVFDKTSKTYIYEDAAARVAGLIARVDAQVGFWKSPSNEELFGVGSLGRPIDWALGDPNTRANLLNSNEVATVIREDGFRLWGNRTASQDQKWAFLCVSRTADMIDISIMRAHRWAVDRVINKQYFADVTASVNAYLRSLKARGAILGGTCWADPDKNTPADLAAGHATFSYDFTAPAPAERITFESTLTDAYFASIFTNAA